MPQKQAWSVESWQWDPYKLVAAPADEQAVPEKKALEAGGEASSSGSPTSSGDQPAKLASRSKGPPTCQVNGCLTDLTGLKEYHNRYKICEYHLKIPSIVREGSKQRFCQQCGRFHDLGEFDGDKRSCRARLQRHNARRRKKGDTEPAKGPKKGLAGRQIKELPHAVHSRSASPMSDDAIASSESSKPNLQYQPAAQHQQSWQQADFDGRADGHSQDWTASTGMALEHAFTDFLKQENAQQAMHTSMAMPAFLPDGCQPSTLTHQVHTCSAAALAASATATAANRGAWSMSVSRQVACLSSALIRCTPLCGKTQVYTLTLSRQWCSTASIFLPHDADGDGGPAG